MAGATDLDGHAHGQLGWIDDGLPLLVDLGLGQYGMPGALAVTRLTAHAWLHEVLLLQVNAGGVASAAFLQPGPFLPVVLVVVDETARVDVVLDGRDVELAFLLNDVALLPLTTDGEQDLLHLGDIDLVGGYLELLFVAQVFPDPLLVEVDHEGVFVGPHILDHSTVEGLLPRIVMLQMTCLADLGAHVRLGIGQHGLNIRGLFPRAAHQAHAHKPQHQARHDTIRIYIIPLVLEQA